MSDQLQRTGNDTNLSEKDISELMSDLTPVISRMKSDVAFLRTSADAMFHSLQQIKFVAWNNGYVRYDMIVEIIKKNNIFALSQTSDHLK